jgi:hypothetical protein
LLLCLPQETKETSAIDVEAAEADESIDSAISPDLKLNLSLSDLEAIIKEAAATATDEALKDALKPTSKSFFTVSSL